VVTQCGLQDSIIIREIKFLSMTLSTIVGIKRDATFAVLEKTTLGYLKVSVSLPIPPPFLLQPHFQRFHQQSNQQLHLQHLVVFLCGSMMPIIQKEMKSFGLVEFMNV